MLQLNVSQIKRTPGAREHHELEFEPGTVTAEGETLVFSGPLSLSLTITNVNTALSVEGIIKAGLILTCGRCLESYQYDLECPLSETYYFSSDGSNPPDEEWIFFSGEMLDITSEVYKAIVLVLPMRGLCRDTCQGLCPVCGINLNTKQCRCEVDDLDPRLNKLQELLKK